MANTDPKPPAIAYDETPFPGWIEEVEKWHWNRHLTFFDKKGTCLRCLHEMSALAAHAIGIEIERIEDFPCAENEDYVWCNCGFAHPPHAAGEGCGQHGCISSPPQL